MANLIPGYPKGSDLTLLNVLYHRRVKTDEGMIIKDKLVFIYKDNKANQKKCYIMENPKYTYYIEDEDCGYRKFFEEEKKLRAVTVPYRELKKSIAKELGRLEEFYDNIKSGNAKENTYMLKDNRLFGADLAIGDYYRLEFSKWYTNEVVPVSKLFLDIETDNSYIGGAFPSEPGCCPINAVSILDYDSRTLFTFLLDDPKNPQIAAFRQRYAHKNNFHQEFMELLTDTLGGPKRVEHFGLQDLKTEQIFYTDEVLMLVELFDCINKVKPDFVLAWNMAFDIPFIISRLLKLGVDPTEVICPKDIPLDSKVCGYIVDYKHLNEKAERGDYANIDSWSVYLDQMIQFASRRKGQSAFSSTKLDYVGETVAKVNKLDYSHITTNISKLPYLNYEIFVKYNMMDVIVQYCIERETSDIDFVFNRVTTNFVGYPSAHRQTIYLANTAAQKFYQYGQYILGNNINKFDPKKETFEGALVADPTLVSPKNKIKVNGTALDLVNNLIDFDFTSMYPFIDRENNMAPNTQVGKIIIHEQVYENANRLHNPLYNLSGNFIEDYLSDNYLEFMHRWFKLGNFEEIYKDIFEYFTYHESAFDDSLQDHIWHSPIISLVIGPDNPVQRIDPNRNMCKVKQLSDEQKKVLTRLFGRETLDVVYNEFANGTEISKL